MISARPLHQFFQSWNLIVITDIVFCPPKTTFRSPVSSKVARMTMESRNVSSQVTVGFENCLFVSETAVYSRAHRKQTGSFEVGTPRKQWLQIIPPATQLTSCCPGCVEMSKRPNLDTFRCVDVKQTRALVRYVADRGVGVVNMMLYTATGFSAAETDLILFLLALIVEANRKTSYIIVCKVNVT